MRAPDKLLTNPIRLAIVAYLNQVAGADFAALQEVTEATKGNLSIQLKKLQEAQYIQIQKSFKENYPHTNCTITPEGKKALEQYVDYLKGMLRL